jgi:hypothetical protein
MFRRYNVTTTTQLHAAMSKVEMAAKQQMLRQ